MDSNDITDHEHKFQSAHQLYLATKKPFHNNLDIPPRKLLTRRLHSLSSEPSLDINYQHNNINVSYDSPKFLSEETLFQKFLPNNITSVDDEDDDPYSSDEFRMYEFKIRKCTRSRSHDWTDCPFAHPGEKARRRCTRRFHYSADICPDFRRGSCPRGDMCEFSHGVFESWLHPSRYRTEACKDGKTCQRKVCFFAHTPGQLRTISAPATEKRMMNNAGGHCAYCRYHPGFHHTTSPTSILDFDPRSPPPSPSQLLLPAPPGAGYTPISRFAGAGLKDSKKGGLINHQEIVELMRSMNVMNMNATDHQGPNLNPHSNPSFNPHSNPSFNPHSNPKLIKMESFSSNDGQNSFFSYSPLTPSSSACGSSRVLPEDQGNYGMNAINEGMFVGESSSSGGPDFGWLNDLMMDGKD